MIQPDGRQRMHYAAGRRHFPNYTGKVEAPKTSA